MKKRKFGIREVWDCGEGQNPDGLCLGPTLAWLSRFMERGVPEDLEGEAWVKSQG
jgi:hypothetical protein